MSDFKKFRSAIQKQFDKMARSGSLFISEVSKDDIWDSYLKSFPEGTNPLFRERTEHDCVCCKQFIRYVGRVMGEVDGKLVSVWDIEVDGFYGEVAKALSKLNHSTKIAGLFIHNEREIGRDHSFETLADGSLHKWDHFYQVVPASSYMKVGAGEVKGAAQTNRSVLERSLVEISNDAIETVQELIFQNAIYRGEEHLPTINLIQKLKREIEQSNNKDLYLWQKAVELKGVCSLRNTVIGTLIVDISNNEPLEEAVKKFESKVAPHNYKRSTALVTPKMKEEAKKKAKELGIEPSLMRRHATKHDISINDILFADGSIKPFMEDSVFDAVPVAKQAKSFDKLQEISIEKFIKDVLPTATSVELLLENKHNVNLMSIVAPVHMSAPNIMKWNNNFSWSYKGNIADSDIKTRVKAAGGTVNAPFRISLSWNSRDDLDLHMIEPTKGRYNNGEVYFANKRGTTGSELDVDMRGEKPQQVENIFWKNTNELKAGEYSVFVHNYYSNSQHQGDPARVEGFEVEVELFGDVFTMSYNKKVKHNDRIEVMNFTVKDDGSVVFNTHLNKTAQQQTYWNKQTNEFHKVDMVMLSPNHWNGQSIGNKHYFFILDGCVNDEATRGFYNEFLLEELNPHRKVFEVLADNLKVSYDSEQLSGVGFSSTQRNEATLRVKGSVNRLLKVKF